MADITERLASSSIRPRRLRNCNLVIISEEAVSVSGNYDVSVASNDRRSVLFQMV